MGVPANPLINVSVSQQSSGSSLLRKYMEAQARRRCQTTKQRQHGWYMKSKRPRKVVMKRKTRSLDGSRRIAEGIQRRVRTLKRLIPNSESMGLDGLFRETADYILSLQTRVKAMQIMVEALAGSDE